MCQAPGGLCGKLADIGVCKFGAKLTAPAGPVYTHYILYSARVINTVCSGRGARPLVTSYSQTVDQALFG